MHQANIFANVKTRFHASVTQLQPLFDTVPQTPVLNTPEERAVGDYLRGGWIAFAKNQTGGLLEYANGWPLYAPNEATLIRLAYDSRIGRNLTDGNPYDGPCAA